MTQRRKRSPQNGNHVSVHGKKGTFVIYGIDRSLQTVEVKLMGHDLALSSIPWNRLTFLDDKDASQVILRIVREATEGR